MRIKSYKKIHRIISMTLSEEERKIELRKEKNRLRAKLYYHKNKQSSKRYYCCYCRCDVLLAGKAKHEKSQKHLRNKNNKKDACTQTCDINIEIVQEMKFSVKLSGSENNTKIIVENA